MASRIHWQCHQCGHEGNRDYFTMRLGIQCPVCGSLSVEPRDSGNPYALLDEIVSAHGVELVAQYLEQIQAQLATRSWRSMRFVPCYC